MKTLIFVTGILAGVFAGVRLEANTEALKVARLTGANYFQVVNRPHLINELAIDAKADADDDEADMRAGESTNG